VITARATAFAKAAAEGGSAPVEVIAGKGDAGLSSFVSAEVARASAPN
jgi:electron transfer flavoprotein alpha subunit